MDRPATGHAVGVVLKPILVVVVAMLGWGGCTPRDGPGGGPPPHQRGPSGAVAEVTSFLEADFVSFTGGEPFSVLEIAPRDGLSVGGHLAGRMPDVTWLTASDNHPEWLATDKPKNLLQVKKLTLESIQRIHRSPQLFEYLLIFDFADLFLGKPQASLGLLLSMSRRVVVYVDPGSGITSLTTAKLQQAGKQLVDAAEEQKIGVLVQNVKGNILTVEVTSLVRPVQHHFDDRRPATDGGTCYKYKLFHKTTTGVRGTPWLCQAKQDAALRSGSTAPRSVEQCPADPECDERTINLKNSNWVNLKLLAGLGLGDTDKKNIIRSYLELPEFRDCPMWNACAAGSSVVWCDSDAVGLQSKATMEAHLNQGCARLDVGMKYDANPACCIDLLLSALDPDHCGMSEEEAQSLGVGFAFDLNKATVCRRQHLGVGFIPLHFQDSFVNHAQESFVFGSGREPSRMTKDEIEKELQKRGISSEVAKQSSKMGLGNAKEQLIQRLERARLDTSDMSRGELVTELRRISLSPEGSDLELARRLHNARELAYGKVKSKLLKGRVRNRIELLRTGPESLSKDELKDYLIEAGLDVKGEKSQLVSRLSAAWSKRPELKTKAIADLERQLEMGDALLEIRMAEQQEKSRVRLGNPQGAPAIWDAGSTADLGRDTGLGLPSVQSMNKKELQDEARAAGLPTGGTKEVLQKAVQKARRLGQSGPLPGGAVAHSLSSKPPQLFSSGFVTARSLPFAGMQPGGYDGRVDMFADRLVQTAARASDIAKSPERMSRQELISALEDKGLPTASLSKEKLIAAATKAGISKAGDAVAGIRRYMDVAGQSLGSPRVGPQGWGGRAVSPQGGYQQVGGSSLRDRLMAREAQLAGPAFGMADVPDGGGRIASGRGGALLDSVTKGKLAAKMSRAELQDSLSRAGLPTSGSKEQLLDRVVSRMTKEEMVQQLQMMKQNFHGRKMELKDRIVGTSKAWKQTRLR